MTVICIYCNKQMEVPEGDPHANYAHEECFNTFCTPIPGTDEYVENITWEMFLPAASSEDRYIEDIELTMNDPEDIIDLINESMDRRRQN